MAPRPIRVWHIPTKRLCPVLEITFDDFGGAPFRSCIFETGSPPHYDTAVSRFLILMEATGIQDRYGADIYEGDVLNVRTDDRRNLPAVVVRGTDVAAFVYTVPGGTPTILRAGADIEVVATVHEHPELLNT